MLLKSDCWVLIPSNPIRFPTEAFGLLRGNFPKRYRIGGGGAKEDRTPDLLRARQALSQLSYGPSVSLSSLALTVLYTPARRPPPKGERFSLAVQGMRRGGPGRI
jgi:hypothetical protein